jgi:hypothetical protein
MGRAGSAHIGASTTAARGSRALLRDLTIQRETVMSAREPLLLFCYIYSGSRAIALDTAALWASLHLSLDFVFTFCRCGETEPLPIFGLQNHARK